MKSHLHGDKLLLRMLNQAASCQQLFGCVNSHTSTV
jgi:hypothetical protein